jgi:hypothetical protein
LTFNRCDRRILLIVRLTRATDGKNLYTETFAYGGGFWGTLTKLSHAKVLEFRTAEELVSQPKLVAERLAEAARLLGARAVEELKSK